MSETLDVSITYGVARSMVQIADEASYAYTESGLDAETRRAIERVGQKLAGEFETKEIKLRTVFGIAPRDNHAVTITVNEDTFTDYLLGLDRLANQQGIRPDIFAYVLDSLLHQTEDELGISRQEFTAVPLSPPRDAD